MGRLLKAVCKCGFESNELCLGSGMSAEVVHCQVPYYCDICKIISFTDITEQISNGSAKIGDKKIIRCRHCGKEVQYYGEIVTEKFDQKEDSLFGWPVNKEMMYFLKNKLYRCPVCKKNNLKFNKIGWWD